MQGRQGKQCTLLRDGVVQLWSTCESAMTAEAVELEVEVVVVVV